MEQVASVNYLLTVGLFFSLLDAYSCLTVLTRRDLLIYALSCLACIIDVLDIHLVHLLTLLMIQWAVR